MYIWRRECSEIVLHLECFLSKKYINVTANVLPIYKVTGNIIW